MKLGSYGSEFDLGMCGGTDSLLSTIICKMGDETGCRRGVNYLHSPEGGSTHKELQPLMLFLQVGFLQGT